MLESVRFELSESDDTDINNSILDLISAAKADLILSGVHINKVVDTDALIKRAVILFCKANYRYDPFTERYNELYKGLKIHLLLSREYTEVI